MAFSPNYSITNSLLQSAKQIAALTAELNRRVIAQPILVELERRASALSSHASTRIEGNPLPLTEVKKLLKSLPANLGTSEREVVNYNAALSSLHQQLQDASPALTLKRILGIHRTVMKGLLEPYHCGRLRAEPVVVNDPRTGRVVYLAPDAKDVRGLLDECLAFLQTSQRAVDPLILAGLFHRQFVIIHPFTDGNGRTVRLATKVLLATLGIDTFPLFSFENFYISDITRYLGQVGVSGNYYDIRDRIDFTSWLEYFAEGILDELTRVSDELELATASPESTPLPHHRLILKHIERHGYITDRDYSKLTDRAKATRALDFKRLIEWGLIERLGRGKKTYYKVKA